MMDGDIEFPVKNCSLGAKGYQKIKKLLKATPIHQLS